MSGERPHCSLPPGRRAHADVDSHHSPDIETMTSPAIQSTIARPAPEVPLPPFVASGPP